MSRVAVGLVCALLVLGGCAGTPDDPAGSSPAGPPAAASGPPASSGPPAPARSGVPQSLNFTATTLDGAAFDGATLAGKPVVLWFWAPWCPTCARQARGVKTAAEQLAGRVAVVGVGGLDEPAAMRRFVGEWRLQAVPQLADEPGVVWKKFGVTAQSTFVFLDATGAVVFKGVLDGDDVAGRAGKLA
jgi:peroxiredoxin